MEFYDITDDDQPRPGEMLLHEPRHAIVVFAASVDGVYHAFDRGAFLEAPADEFKKIKITPKEHRKRARSKCKGCGGSRPKTRARDTTVTETTTTAAAAGCKSCGKGK